MAPLIFGCLLGLLAVPMALSNPIYTRFLLEKHRRMQGVLEPDVSIDKAISSAFFDQKLDHQNPASGTWKQLYQLNDQFYKPGGPVFLYIGGEGPASLGFISGTQLLWQAQAERHNAMVFQLEHRYYGQSRPTADMSTENLKYLSSRQALDDLDSFIDFATTKYSLQGAKWVTFGGSYSGALSAWFRQKYPNRVVGAIASSAPVLAKLDYFEYLEVVQAALKRDSQNCLDQVGAAFKKVEELLATAEGRATLKTKLRLCAEVDINNKLDVANFWGLLFGDYQFAVQYGGDNVGQFATEVTVPNVCKAITNVNKPDIIDRLVDVHNLVSGSFGCLDHTYAAFIEQLTDTSFNGPQPDFRAFVYQTCVEFGYYQTTTSMQQPFGQHVSLQFYLQQCRDIYGDLPEFSNEAISKAIDDTNQFYGGRDNFTAENVVLINGSQDPWHALGIFETAPNPKSPVVYINGTAHVAELYPASPKDPASLTAARKTINMHLDNILAA